MDMGTKHIILALSAFGAGIGVTRLLGRRSQPETLSSRPSGPIVGGMPFTQSTQDAIAAGEVLGAPRMRGNDRLTELQEMAASWKPAGRGVLFDPRMAEAQGFTLNASRTGVVGPPKFSGTADSVKPEVLTTRGQVLPDSPSPAEIMAAFGAK
jgi:hypothetical protein